MRALVRSEGLRVRAGDADRFGTYVQELTLPAELAAALRPLLAVWAQLTEHLAVADAAVVATAAANPVVQRLTTAPGVGPLIATAFVATLDEAGRFGGAHQVESYLGLVPSEHSSADRHRRGHITKAGNPRMRWVVGPGRVGGAAVPAGRGRRLTGVGGATRQAPRPPHRDRGPRAPLGGDPLCDVAGPDPLRGPARRRRPGGDPDHRVRASRFADCSCSGSPGWGVSTGRSLVATEAVRQMVPPPVFVSSLAPAVRRTALGERE